MRRLAIAMPLLRPEQRPDAWELFFSSSGRLARAPFVAGLACVLGALWVYEDEVSGTPRLATGWAVLSVLLFSGCCLTSRRLHDLGRAGWWTALLWALFLAAWPPLSSPARGVAGGLLGVCAALLCATPGQGRANRFGPPLPGRR
ncbi:DUF805 domain-containing protein [Caulobacter sp. S45]|uniref:DUF805 domain-containing protein n=1 Tax=Caulobacter sp. S45 TaxID=1641861 RepID=UPI0015750B17|nr:DUF805 domain-containing protein [Caulobacter sp. S45]